MTPLVRGPLVDEVGSVVSVVLVDGGSAARAARVVTARVLFSSPKPSSHRARLSCSSFGRSRLSERDGRTVIGELRAPCRGSLLTAASSKLAKNVPILRTGAAVGMGGDRRRREREKRRRSETRKNGSCGETGQYALVSDAAEE